MRPVMTSRISASNLFPAMNNIAHEQMLATLVPLGRNSATSFFTQILKIALNGRFRAGRI